MCFGGSGHSTSRRQLSQPFGLCTLNHPKRSARCVSVHLPRWPCQCGHTSNPPAITPICHLIEAARNTPGCCNKDRGYCCDSLTGQYQSGIGFVNVSWGREGCVLLQTRSRTSSDPEYAVERTQRLGGTEWPLAALDVSAEGLPPLTKKAHTNGLSPFLLQSRLGQKWTQENHAYGPSDHRG